MEILFDTTCEVALDTDVARIASQRISPRVELQQPLRGSSLIPRQRGGRTITFTIEVIHSDEDYSAAEVRRTLIGDSVEEFMGPSDTDRTLYIEGRGTYAQAAIEDVDIIDMGTSTKVIWRFVTSGSQVVL